MRWNLNLLTNPRDNVLVYMSRDYCYSYDFNGLLNSLLYIASPYSVFPWHIEEYDTYAINYLHWGFPKLWHW